MPFRFVESEATDNQPSLLCGLQDTLYLLTLDDCAPLHLLTSLVRRANWQQLCLSLIEALVTNGLAELSGAEGDLNTTLRTLRENAYRGGGDDLDWSALLLSSTDKGMERVAQLGIDDLHLPPTAAVEEQAAARELLAEPM